MYVGKKHHKMNRKPFSPNPILHIAYGPFASQLLVLPGKTDRVWLPLRAKWIFHPNKSGRNKNFLTRFEFFRIHGDRDDGVK